MFRSRILSLSGTIRDQNGRNGEGTMVGRVLTTLRARQEWRFFRALRRAAPAWAVAWWALVVLRGVVPAGVSVAFGWLVDAVDRGGSLAGPLTLTGVLFTSS